MRAGFSVILSNAEMEIEYAEDFLYELKTSSETRKLWRAWSGLLGHYVRAVSAIRRATDVGSSKSWSDQLLSQQRNDKILQYAFQARNTAGHVFEEKREARPRSVSLGGLVRVAGNADVIAENNWVSGSDGVFRKLPDGDFRVEDGMYVGGSIPANKLIHKEHFVVVGTVRNKDGTWVVPNPDTPEEDRAIEIADYLVEWLKLRLSEAKEMAALENAVKKRP